MPVISSSFVESGELLAISSDEERTVAAVQAGARPPTAMLRTAWILLAVSTGLLAVLALRPAGGAQTSAQLDAVGLFAAQLPSDGGWYKTAAETSLEKGSEPGSELVDVLPAGSDVLVAEVRGDRARLSQPAAGWVALRSRSGGVALAASGVAGDGLMEAFDQGEQMRRVRQELRITGDKLHAAHRKLMEAVDHLSHSKALHEVAHRTGQVGRAARDHAPLAKRAVDVAGKKLQESGVPNPLTQNVLHDVARQARAAGGGLLRAFHGL